MQRGFLTLRVWDDKFKILQRLRQLSELQVIIDYSVRGRLQ